MPHSRRLVTQVPQRFPIAKAQGTGSGALRFAAAGSHRRRTQGSEEMFLPPEYFWLEPVIVAAIVVFVIDLIGNTLAFGSRVVNAFVTAVVFALVFGALVYFGYGNISMTVSTVPSASAPANR